MTAESVIDSPLNTEKKLVVRNLSPNVTKQHIEEIFGFYGKIIEIFRPLDSQHGLFIVQKNFCFMEFETHEQAALAMDYMDGAQVDGLVLSIEWRDPNYKKSFEPRRNERVERRERSFSEEEIKQPEPMKIETRDEKPVVEMKWNDQPVKNEWNDTPAKNEWNDQPAQQEWSSNKFEQKEEKSEWREERSSQPYRRNSPVGRSQPSWRDQPQREPPRSNYRRSPPQSYRRSPPPPARRRTPPRRSPPPSQRRGPYEPPRRSSPGRFQNKRSDDRGPYRPYPSRPVARRRTPSPPRRNRSYSRRRSVSRGRSYSRSYSRSRSRSYSSYTRSSYTSSSYYSRRSYSRRRRSYSRSPLPRRRSKSPYYDDQKRGRSITRK